MFPSPWCEPEHWSSRRSRDGWGLAGCSLKDSCQANYLSVVCCCCYCCYCCCLNTFLMTFIVQAKHPWQHCIRNVQRDHEDRWLGPHEPGVSILYILNHVQLSELWTSTRFSTQTCLNIVVDADAKRQVSGEPELLQRVWVFRGDRQERRRPNPKSRRTRLSRLKQNSH